MIRFGRASRRMDLIGLALMLLMTLMLWVQNSALAAGAHAESGAVGAVTGEGGTTGPMAPAGVEHL